VSTLSARQTILLVVLFVVTSLGFIALDNREALDPLKTGVHDLIVPVTDQLTGIGDGSPGDQTAIQQQLDELQAKYDELQAQYAQLMVNAREVEKLRELLGLQQSQPNLTFLPARVLYPDPTNTQKFVIIDKGSADGVRTGMAVTDPNFYVGLVTEVDEHSARVMLAIPVGRSTVDEHERRRDRVWDVAARGPDGNPARAALDRNAGRGVCDHRLRDRSAYGRRAVRADHRDREW
jgi:rod shape-determining protein MreC